MTSLYQKCSVIYYWIRSLCKRKLTEEEIKIKVREKLEKWMTEQYANNKYLHVIPENRKRIKREEFRKEIINEYL